MTTVLTQTIARVLFLPALVTAAALLVKGYAGTGDGFSAAVVAAVGVMLQYVAFGHREVERLLPLRHATTAGFAGLLLVLLIAFGPALGGEPVLMHTPRPGRGVIHLGSLELHTAVAFDVGVFLLVFGFAVTATSLIAGTRERGEP